MGTALLRAGQQLGLPDHVRLAGRAADAALGLAPRMQATHQCCGLAGLGEFLLDVADAADAAESAGGPETGGADRRRATGHRVAAIIRAREPDPDREPDLCHDPRPAEDPGVHRHTSWGTGLAGVLGYLRRLQHGGPRLWTPYGTPARPSTTPARPAVLG